MKIIGITGTIGAGKGAAVDYLKRKGFVHFSVRNFLWLEVDHRGLPHVRDSLREVANDLRAQFGPMYIIESMYKEAMATEEDCIIESIRAIGEVEFLKVQSNFTLLTIDADRNVRYGRIVARGSETDHVSFEKFVEDEDKEMNSTDPGGMNIAECMRRADFMIMNNGTLDELHKQLDEVLAQIPH